SLIFIRNIHKNCPLIEYLPLIFPPTKKHFVEIEDIYEESIYDEEILEYGELVQHLPLEKFLETWEGTSILTSNYTYEEDDYKKLINKYKNNGVIKDFGCESYTNVANMDFKI
ncbi:16075_t:CDS:2, partial [Rhizophagus irregularis]